MCVLSRSVVSDSATHGLVAHQAPLSMGFSRQEYWRGLPFPAPGDLPNPGIEPASPALQADSLPLSHLGSLVHAMFHSNTLNMQVCLISTTALWGFTDDTVRHRGGNDLLAHVTCLVSGCAESYPGALPRNYAPLCIFFLQDTDATPFSPSVHCKGFHGPASCNHKCNLLNRPYGIVD